MAFLIYSTDDGHIPPLELLPAGGVNPAVGMALVEEDGVVRTAQGADAPTHISMGRAPLDFGAGAKIPAIRVTSGITFEADAAEGTEPGGAVNLAASGGMGVVPAGGGGGVGVVLSAAKGRALMRFN